MPLDPLDFLDPQIASMLRGTATAIPRKLRNLLGEDAASQLSPEDEQSLLSQIGSGIMAPISYVGETLSKPLYAAAGLLAGKPKELLNILPLSDTLGITSKHGIFGDTPLNITDESQRVAGRELLEAWGAAPPNEPGLDRYDIGGFAIDVLGNPLNFVSGAGTLKALGKGAQALKAANKLKPAMAAAKAAGKGQREWLRSTTLGDLFKTADETIAAHTGVTKASKAAKAAAEAAAWKEDVLHNIGKRGWKPEDIMDEKLGDVFGFTNVPFGQSKVTTGTDWLARWADKMGGKLSNLPPTRWARGFFSGAARGQTASKEAADYASEVSGKVWGAQDEMRRELIGEMRGLAPETKTTGAGEKLRSVLENPAAPTSVNIQGQEIPTKQLSQLIQSKTAYANLNPEMQQAAEAGIKIQNLTEKATRERRAAGGIATMLQDAAGIDYVPRPEDFARYAGDVGAKIYAGLGPDAVRRVPSLKDVAGGTDVVRRILSDPHLHEQIFGGASVKEVRDAVKELYGNFLVGGKNQASTIAKAMTEGFPEAFLKSHQFATHPLASQLQTLPAYVSTTERVKAGLGKIGETAYAPPEGVYQSPDTYAKIGRLRRKMGLKGQGALQKLARTVGENTPESYHNAVRGILGDAKTAADLAFDPKDPSKLLDFGTWKKKLAAETGFSDTKNVGLFRGRELRDIYEEMQGFGPKWEQAVADAKAAGKPLPVPDKGVLTDVLRTTGKSNYLRQFENYRVPRNVADTLLSVDKGFQAPETMGKLGQLLTSGNAFWKAFALLRPNFQVRNYVSGQIANWLHGLYSGVGRMFKGARDVDTMLSGGVVKGLVDHPQIARDLAKYGLDATDANATRMLAERVASHWGQSIHLASDVPWGEAGPVKNLAGMDPKLSALSQQIPGEVPSGMWDAAKDVFKTVFSKKSWVPEGEGSAATRLGKNLLKARGAFGATESGNPLLRANEILGQTVEESNRIGPLIELLRKGHSLDDAFKAVEGVQVDYSPRAFSKAERKVAALAWPFYKFAKGQGKNVLQSLINHPNSKLAAVIRESARLSDQDQAIPEHIKQGLAIPIPEGFPLIGPKPGGDPRYLTGFGLMHENPLSLLGPSPVAGPVGPDTVRRLLAQLSPFLKIPIELGTGTSLFQKGQDIGGRPLSDMDPLIGRLMANARESAGGPREFNVKPLMGSFALEDLISNSPFAPGLSMARTATDTRKGIGAKLANLLTGMRLTDVSPAARDAVVREVLSELMKTKGGLEFVKTYIPQDVLSQMSPTEASFARQMTAMQTELAQRAKRRKLERVGQ